MKLITTKQLADRIGVTPVRVRQLAKARGITPALHTAAVKLWHPNQVRLFKRNPPGRPKNDPKPPGTV
jgi:hypothetical protein